MKGFPFFLLAMAIFTSFPVTSATNEAEKEKPVQVEAASADKLQIDVWWSVHKEDYGDGIVYNYILIENKTKHHVVVYLVYTDNTGEHKLTLHSQTWSDGGFKKRVYTKGHPTINEKESSAEYM